VNRNSDDSYMNIGFDLGVGLVLGVRQHLSCRLGILGMGKEELEMRLKCGIGEFCIFVFDGIY
jgi:hypothetical protein